MFWFYIQCAGAIISDYMNAQEIKTSTRTQRTTILQTHHDHKRQSYRYQGPLIQRASGGLYVLSSSSNVFLWSVLVSFFPSAVSQSPPAVWHSHPWPWSICAPPPRDCTLKIPQIFSPLSPHFDHMNGEWAILRCCHDECAEGWPGVIVWSVLLLLNSDFTWIYNM